MIKVGVIGSYVTDAMARAPHFPKEGETVKGSYFKLSPGGKGLNQAIAAKKAGANLIFSTKIGVDDFGNMALSSLKENNINTNNVIQCNKETTGIALILVNEITKNNEIIVVPGACNTFTKSEIDFVFNEFKEIEYLLVQLEINEDAMLYIIEKAKKLNIKIILNPAPYSDICKSMLDHLYLITPNETEAAQLTNHKCENIEDYRKIANYLFDKKVENVIITLGKKGVYFNNKEIEKIIDNYDVKVIDSTGAGDAYNGGLLAGLSLGYNLFEAVKYASIVSNLSVTKLGTSISMPTRNEITEFITKTKDKDKTEMLYIPEFFSY